jgi:sterol desaturase/sphingolipid hydroxylase (fatty acid hydroxylase superfamily)
LVDELKGRPDVVGPSVFKGGPFKPEGDVVFDKALNPGVRHESPAPPCDKLRASEAVAMKERKVPAWVSAPLVVGAFGLLVWLERRRPLRRAVEPKLRREARNLTVAAVGAVALRVTEKPVADALTSLVERRRWGLLKLFKLPAWLEVALAVVLLDYTLYLWHVLTHRVPFLWRFHVAHHVDLDLDASTALRFHFAELVLSVPWRAGQILLIGVSPLALSAWQNLLFLSILFHHSNLELPFEVERRLNAVVVTPRMHGIHHSIVKEETNSNWSSGLTVWDRLHGTLKLSVPQAEIAIGVPAYRDPEEVGWLEILAMPFGEVRPTWQLPGGGTPERTLPTAPDELAA